MFVELTISEATGYTQVKDAFLIEDIYSKYGKMVELSEMFGKREVEAFEAYKQKFIKLRVSFDEETGLLEKDVYKALERMGLSYKVSDSMLSGSYFPSDKLGGILQGKRNRRQKYLQKEA